MRLHFYFWSSVAAGVFLFPLYYLWTSVQGDHFRLRAQESNKAHSVLWRQQQQEQQLQDPAEEAKLQQATVASLNPDGAYAYGFYATDDQYACSVLVNIHRLQVDLQSPIPIQVIASPRVSESYIAAFYARGATVHIEQPPPLSEGTGGYYADCLLKLLAFKLHRLSPGLQRVLAFDSDQLIMHNLDHLFAGLPEVDIAAPRAYWIAKDIFATTFLLISLSDRLWETVHQALGSIGAGKFDMDLINDLFGDQVMMLGGEYVTLNSHWEDWNLPKWYHPTLELNMTAIDKVNGLARATQPSRRSIYRENPSPRPNLTNPPQAAQAVPPSPYYTPDPDPDPVPLPLPPPPLPEPRFPAEHPLARELDSLQDRAAVIHFTAAGKPWMLTPDSVKKLKPDAHPLLAAQFDTWRQIAAASCPDYGDGAPDPTSTLV